MPGEAIEFRSVSGGGYGDPLERPAERVARDVNRKWVSVERAQEAFKVALALAHNGVDYVVDEPATRRLRDAR